MLMLFMVLVLLQMVTSVIYSWGVSKQRKAILAFLRFMIDSATKPLPTTSLNPQSQGVGKS